MRLPVCMILAALMVSGCSDTDPTTTPASDSGQPAVNSPAQPESPPDSPKPEEASISATTPEASATPLESSVATPETSTTNTETPETDIESTATVTEQIRGRWVIVEANVSGQAMGAMKGGVAEIEGDKITVKAGGVQAQSTITFHQGTTPLQFDAADSGGQTAKAILEIHGDELTVNTSLTGASYPASFDPGPGLMLVKYKRE